MKDLQSKIEKNFDKIMLGTIGIGLLGEALYFVATKETLPSGELTGFYRGFFEAGPAYILAGRRLLSCLVGNRIENAE